MHFCSHIDRDIFLSKWHSDFGVPACTESWVDVEISNADYTIFNYMKCIVCDEFNKLFAYSLTQLKKLFVRVQAFYFNTCMIGYVEPLCKYCPIRLIAQKIGYVSTQNVLDSQRSQ
mmetsp:Transcript_11047/g.20642  ORF Transcript_11047/g.20642 Transcript_11047/m.20642 type:complete len:116 (-) Transcript_11047:947-1294(-)